MSFRDNNYKQKNQTIQNDSNNYYNMESGDSDAEKSVKSLEDNNLSLVSPNRTPIFSSLRKSNKRCYSNNINRTKTRNRQDEMSDISTIRVFRSSNYGYVSPLRNKRSDLERNESDLDNFPDYQSDDLYNRSVISVTERTHRSSFQLQHRPKAEDDDLDQLFSYQRFISPSSNKNFNNTNHVPLSERLTETKEKKQKFVEQFETESQKKFNEECPFTPTIVSKQTTMRSTDRVKHDCSHHHHPNEPEEISSFYDGKSKEIAEKVAKGTDIFLRQTQKLYSSSKNSEVSSEESFHGKKMTKKELQESINRLTTVKNDEELNSDKDEEIEMNDTNNSKQTVKYSSKSEMMRLLEDSLTENKEKRIQLKMEIDKKRYDVKPPVEYKYQIDEKSQEIIDSLQQDDRDLFEESVKVHDYNVNKAYETHKYYEELEKRQIEESTSEARHQARASQAKLANLMKIMRNSQTSPQAAHTASGVRRRARAIQAQHTKWDRTMKASPVRYQKQTNKGALHLVMMKIHSI